MSLSRLLPFAGRARPKNPFTEEFQKIAELSVSATRDLLSALKESPEEALARIVETEHQADDAVRTIHQLVDRTFVTPYDKRDIIKLAHRLDAVVDSMRTATRLLVGYRALQANNGDAYSAHAGAMCDLILSAATRLKQIVDGMPAFHHEELREAVRVIEGIEDESDELFAQAIQNIFADPNQPLTAGMLAWRDVFQLLERTTDYCSHAMAVIVSIARQEGS